jgi:hypothetical protein
LTRANALVVALFGKFLAEGGQAAKSASPESPARNSGLAGQLNVEQVGGGGADRITKPLAGERLSDNRQHAGPHAVNHRLKGSRSFKNRRCVLLRDKERP